MGDRAKGGEILSCAQDDREASLRMTNTGIGGS
jgi:hypothetical protein